jgi:ABC-type cobalamin/Fe3+-siderophores transport system ATPase subunit
MLRADKLTIGHRGRKTAGPLSFGFSDGKCVMLCGPNGSGKSTLMKTIAGVIPPLSGSFSAGGRIVMVPTRIPKVKGFTVTEFIRTSLTSESGLFGKLKDEAEKSLRNAIELLELEKLAGKDISLISDGEYQKACIATALTRKADVVLLDEPTAFLDVDNRIMVLRTLYKLSHETGATVVFSTHDIHDGAKFSDTTLSLASSREALF